MQLNEFEGVGYVAEPVEEQIVDWSGIVPETIPKFVRHGWFMWGAWFLGGYLLLLTKRYAKANWNMMHYFHAILGYTVTAITIAQGVKMIKGKGLF